MDQENLIEQNVECIIEALDRTCWDCESRLSCTDKTTLFLSDGRRTRSVEVLPGRIRIQMPGTTICLPMPDSQTPHKLIHELERTT